MKFHTSLPVKSISDTKKFYSILFDSLPAKEENDYIKFLPELVDLNISFIRTKEVSAKGLHLGFEVKDLNELDFFHKRLEAAGLLKTSNKEREDSTCCFARQDKFWVVDPSGYEWEIYTILADSKEFRSESESSCCIPVEAENDKDSKSQCCDSNSNQCG